MKKSIFIISIIFIILIIISFYFINKELKSSIKEHYCKVGKTSNMGNINDPRVLLNYAPQENILTSSCQDYWKEEPKEWNSELVHNNPIPINTEYIQLPKEKIFGDNSYKKGLVDYDDLAKAVKDPDDDEYLDGFEEKLLDPLTKEPLEYEYQLKYRYDDLNRTTNINRWKDYKPDEENYFPYDQIKSPIEDINILNMEFIDRINNRQKGLVTKEQALLFGIIKFNIFRYHIQKIEYKKKSPESNDLDVCYVVHLYLFRNSDLYLNTFSYKGCIKDGMKKLYNVKYIGGNPNDNFLMADGSSKYNLNQEIINDKYTNKVEFENNASVIANMQKKYEESYKIKEQYACFNIMYETNQNEYILPFYNKQQCESLYDEYGKTKPIGIYDKPCKKNEECMFFQENKNYKNDYGRCINGTCQLPVNMRNLGYHYYINHRSLKPLCYNCKSNKWLPNTKLDFCCEEQKDRKKYPYLKSPDYAFEGDSEFRLNNYMQKNCKMKPIYSNIFEKPNIFKIDCQGYLDTYYLKNTSTKKN